MTRLSAILVLTLLLLAGAMPSVAYALQRAVLDQGEGKPTGESAEMSTEHAGEALREGNFPWYDKANNQPKPVKQPRKQRRLRRTPSFSLGPLFSEILQIAFVVLLVALLAGIIYLLIRAYLKQERPEIDPEGDAVQVMTDETRVEQLPFNVAETNVDFLEQARKHYQASEYNDAIVYLYSYMLLHLDRNQLIRLSKGKTNRQYLREIREKRSLSELLEGTMVAFEEAFFGRHTLDRQQFEASWTKLDHFHAQVKEAAA